MDFKLDKQHEMARQLFKDFAENEVKPLAQETDETEVFPRETVDKMMKLGFMGIAIPKEYGGQGCDPLMYTMCVEELAKVCGTTSVIVSAHSSLGADPIMMYGTEEQKKKYLVPLASGEKLGAFGLTEPGAGTDAQGQQTKAVLDGDDWCTGQRFRNCHAYTGWWTYWYRCSGTWSGRRCFAGNNRLCKRKKTVRSFDCTVPEYTVPAC